MPFYLCLFFHLFFMHIAFRIYNRFFFYYLAETITDADYAHYPALLVNTPAEAESQLHSLEHAARGISLFVKSDNTEFMCFIQDGTISSLNSNPLNMVHQIRDKTGTVIDLSTIPKPDLLNENRSSSNM